MVELRQRAWQGIFSVALWVVLSLVVSFAPLPQWAAMWFPIPVLLIAGDAVGPSPLFVRHNLGVTRGTYAIAEVAVILAALYFGVGALLNSAPRSDQPLTLACAARDLVRGIDPYSTFEPQCLQELHYTGVAVTPLMTGPFAKDRSYPSNAQLIRAVRQDQAEGRGAGFPAFGYPPEATLLLVPVAFASWTWISLWVAAISCTLALAMWLPRPRVPRALIAWQLVALAMVWIPFRWNPEIIAYLLLGCSFALINQRRVSPIAMAAAVLTNPLSWLAGPVYIAITAREPGFRPRMKWLSISLVVGLLPWYLWDHNLPAELWRFVTLREFPLGASVGTLLPLSSGAKPILTAAFGILALSAAATAWLRPQLRWAMAVAVWGAFLVSWRAPLYYYVPILWLTPALLAGMARLSAEGPTARNRRTAAAIHA